MLLHMTESIFYGQIAFRCVCDTWSHSFVESEKAVAMETLSSTAVPRAWEEDDGQETGQLIEPRG